MNHRIITKIALLGCTLASSLTIAKEGSKSADEIAKELANPNTALASLNFKLQYRTFKGDLAQADDQQSTMVLFQPSLPFPREDGSKVIFRPAIPILTDQPVLGAGGFTDEGGLGDITFDLVYAPKAAPGALRAYGLFGTLPTGNEDVGQGESTALGPDFLYGQMTSENVFGVLGFHQWDIAGDVDISQSNAQIIAVFLPGGGWSYASSPTISYDWKGEEWTVPLNFNFGKTLVLGSRPWKFGLEFNYYLEQPDAFGPEWMVSFSISPVVDNVIANWFR
ncbi:MAG: hypothetical protein V7707_17625 [Motiliproteus sp.]